MSLFDEFLERRHRNQCPLPLWKLKITDEEFEELRKLLEIRSNIINLENPFKSYSRECTLFFAEYWRRIYTNGSHSISNVYESIKPKRNTPELVDAFYEAAKEGAESLGIEKYEGGKAEHINDMLYQGGLPMNVVTDPTTDSNWDRFARGLVNRKINFEELNLGSVAMQSESLREFCELLIDAISAESTQLMPFHCCDKTNIWFCALIELAKKEKKRKKELHPFEITWEFEVNTIKKTMNVFYLFKGSQTLTSYFLAEHNLKEKSYFSVQVKRNGQPVQVFEYKNNFCRYAVFSKNKYELGDYVSVYIHEEQEQYVGDELDMSIPRLLFRNSKGSYELGNKIGQYESLLLIPESWQLISECQLPKHTYRIGVNPFVGIEIPEKFTDEIKLEGPDGTITFGSNVSLYWTEIQSSPLYLPYFNEAMYDAENCLYRLCYDTEDGSVSKLQKVEYRSKYDKEWVSKAPYGEVFVRAIEKNGHFVTPTKITNIGKSITVSIQNADERQCSIRVVWPHGRVFIEEGAAKANDVWEIRKDKCEDKRKIHITCIPDTNSRNQFSITLKAPFKEFSIRDDAGQQIQNEVWLPYSDIDRYQYHLVGQKIKKYTYGTKSKSIGRLNDKLYVYEGPKRVKEIPFEGSLMNLFDSREELRSLLDRTSQNMLEAFIKVDFYLDNGNVFTFYVKENPYRLFQNEEGAIIVRGNNKVQIPFKGRLKLIQIDKPNSESKEITCNPENGCFYLPEEVNEWGNTLVYGRTRGRICPFCVTPGHLLSGEERWNNRYAAIDKITKALDNAQFGAPEWDKVVNWFYKAQEEDIPASSLLELDCVAKRPGTLLGLAFLLFIRTSNDELDELRKKLMVFSNDLAFQWYWLYRYDSINLLINFLPKDILSPFMKEIFIRWIKSLDMESRPRYIVELTNNTYVSSFNKAFNDVISRFEIWMQELYKTSLLENYNDVNESDSAEYADWILSKDISLLPMLDMPSDEYVEFSQDNLGEEVSEFFNAYQDSYIPRNEAWLRKRANAVADFISTAGPGKNIFDLDDKIRRSIIFASKISNKIFIISLFNKLKTFK